MSGGDTSGLRRDIGTLFSSGTLGGLTDRQLLDRFVNRNDASSEDAFTILVQRHGPMVWGVCRRLLSDQDAAADAFQATFLVLVRRAGVVKVDDSLGPWLYGVCRRVAARARTSALRRRARESGGAVEAVARPVPDPDLAERLALLDEEIGRLPAHQRAAIVLCDLESLPHDEAARRLGCPVGTVESRLSRGRQRLRHRLIRRGLAPSAVALWPEMARDASAAMPADLINQTARFITNSPVAGAVPVAVTALAQGVIQMMWLAKLKPLVAVAAALIVTTTGVAVVGRQQAVPERAKEQAKNASAQSVGAGGAPLAARDVTAERALARQQLVLINGALEMLHRLTRNARIELGTPSIGIWERRKLETLRKAGAGKAEIIAALEETIKSLNEYEAMAKARKESARGTELDVYEFQFRRMEAEGWLQEEKAR